MSMRVTPQTTKAKTMPNDPMTTTGQNLERLNKEGTTTSRSSSKKVVKKTPGRPSPEAIIEKNASKAIEDINEVLRGEQAGLEMPRRIVMIALPVIALLVRKNRNYGDSFSRSPELAPDLTANQGLRTRLSDKFARLKSLLSGEPDRVGESLLDTVRDMVGYFLLWLVEHSLKDAPVHMEWDVPESIGEIEPTEELSVSEEIATMEDQIDSNEDADVDNKNRDDHMGTKYCGTCGSAFGYSVWGKENRYEPPCCVGSHWTVDKPART